MIFGAQVTRFPAVLVGHDGENFTHGSELVTRHGHCILQMVFAFAIVPRVQEQIFLECTPAMQMLQVLQIDPVVYK